MLEHFRKISIEIMVGCWFFRDIFPFWLLANTVFVFRKRIIYSKTFLLKCILEILENICMRYLESIFPLWKFIWKKNSSYQPCFDKFYITIFRHFFLNCFGKIPYKIFAKDTKKITSYLIPLVKLSNVCKLFS